MDKDLTHYLTLGAAILGGLMHICGAWRLSCDVSGEISIKRFKAALLFPIYILVCLVSSYRYAKKGAFISLAGIWLTVPFLGGKIWEEGKKSEEFKRQFSQRMENFEEEVEEKIEEAIADAQSADGTPLRITRPPTRLERAQARLSQFNIRLNEWHARLQQQRTALNTADTAAVAQFNKEAAAYAAYNNLTKHEVAALAELQKKIAKK